MLWRLKKYPSVDKRKYIKPRSFTNPKVRLKSSPVLLSHRYEEIRAHLRHVKDMEEGQGFLTTASGNSRKKWRTGSMKRNRKCEMKNSKCERRTGSAK